MRSTRLLVAISLGAVAAPAAAGPPYLTDDPLPTDLGHWEVYAFTAAEGRRSEFDDSTGVDLNYGAWKDVQLTATVPAAITHDPSGWSGGTGDLELAVKYRIVNDERDGFSVAVFPRAILPTSTLEDGEKIRLLLAVWLQKDFAGGTSVFGGGGYELNPGAGNRDFWQGGIAVTHDLGDKLSLGAEVARQGPDTIGGAAETSAGAGAIVKLGGPCALLLSGGPTWSAHRTRYHFYAALGLNF